MKAHLATTPPSHFGFVCLFLFIFFCLFGTEQGHFFLSGFLCVACEQRRKISIIRYLRFELGKGASEVPRAHKKRAANDSKIVASKELYGNLLDGHPSQESGRKTSFQRFCMRSFIIAGCSLELLGQKGSK